MRQNIGKVYVLQEYTECFFILLTYTIIVYSKTCKDFMCVYNMYTCFYALNYLHTLTSTQLLHVILDQGFSVIFFVVIT